MTSITLRAAVAGQAAIHELRRRVARLGEERGQVSIEWVGIFALVGALVALIVGSGLHTEVQNAVKTAIQDIFHSGPGGGGGG